MNTQTTIEKNPFSLNDPKLIEYLDSIEKIKIDIKKIKDDLARKTLTLTQTLSLHIESYTNSINELKSKCTHTYDDGKPASDKDLSGKLAWSKNTRLVKYFTCQICGREVENKSLDIDVEKYKKLNQQFFDEMIENSVIDLDDFKYEMEDSYGFEEIEFNPHFDLAIKVMRNLKIEPEDLIDVMDPAFVIEMIEREEKDGDEEDEFEDEYEEI